MSKDYNIGYGKPPARTRFKPGQSGNPKGRPKGNRNLATDLEEELSEKILVNEGGRQLETTKQRAMIKALLAKALKGDTRAGGVLIQLKLGLEQTRTAHNSEAPLDEEDREILESFVHRVANPAQKEST
jgi:hypothetical protein